MTKKKIEVSEEPIVRSCKDNFWIIAYTASYKDQGGVERTSIGFNYVPEGDVTLNNPDSVDVSEKAEAVTNEVKEVKQDDFQDKVSRGASWNNAFSLVLVELEDKKHIKIDDFCQLVAEAAECIAPYQKSFVNNEPVVKKEPEVAPTQSEEPPSPTEAPPEAEFD